MKYTLLGVAAITAIFLTIFYNVYAWSYVVEWFWNGFIVKYYELKAMNYKAAQVVILGLSLLSTLWGFQNMVKKDEPEGSTDWVVNIGSAVVVVLLMPWFTQFILFVNILVFNL